MPGGTRIVENSTVPHRFVLYVANNDATCETDGAETAQCDYNCGETSTRSVIGSATGHSYTKYESNNNVTCTQDGTKTNTNSVIEFSVACVV